MALVHSYLNADDVLLRVELVLMVFLHEQPGQQPVLEEGPIPTHRVLDVVTILQS